MPYPRNAHRMVSFGRTPLAGPPSGRAAGPTARGPELRFDLYDPDAPPPKQPSRAPLLVIPLVLTALLVVAFARSLVVRTLLPLALAAAAVVLLVQRSRRAKLAEKERMARRGLLLRSPDLRFKAGAGDLARTVLDRSQPFGATLLSTHRRDRLVLLLTSERGVFHVGTTVDGASLPMLALLLSRATTVA